MTQIVPRGGLCVRSTTLLQIVHSAILLPPAPRRPLFCRQKCSQLRKSSEATLRARVYMGKKPDEEVIA